MPNLIPKKIIDKLFVLSQEKNLKNELVRLEEQHKLTRKFPEYGTSTDDNIQEIERFQENLSLQKNLRNLIKDTKSALKRIEKGSYGTCESCGQQIENGRLKVYPSAAVCVSCSNKKRKK
jgi:RNA polymerase-binding transcription factor DksA